MIASKEFIFMYETIGKHLRRKRKGGGYHDADDCAWDGSRLISIAQVSEQACCGRGTRVLVSASKTRRLRL